MNKTSYQKPEIRDANNNIIQNGTYGKNTAFCNAQNTGVLDYINNNLEALNDTKANNSDVSNKVSKTGDTMSGRLTFSNGDIARSNNESELDISGGSSWGGGASIALYGKSSSKTPASVRLHAQNDSSSADIYLYADGTTTAPTPATTDNSAKIATTAFVRNSSVNRAGDTMNGGLTFNDVRPTIKKTSIIKGTLPSIDRYTELIGSVDNNNNYTGLIFFRHYADGMGSLGLRVYNNAGTYTNLELLKIDNNGNATTTAFTPATTDNGTKIATTAFVNSACLTKTTTNITTTQTYTTNNTYIYKVGKLVVVRIWLQPSSNISAWTALGTLPNGYRPDTIARGVGYYNGSACVIDIGSDGTVGCNVALSAPNTLYAMLSYFAV